MHWCLLATWSTSTLAVSSGRLTLFTRPYVGPCSHSLQEITYTGTTQVFPGILPILLQPLAHLIESHVQARTETGHPPSLEARECIALCETLMGICLSDYYGPVPPTWKAVGLQHALQRSHFPFVDSSVMDLSTLSMRVTQWPKTTGGSDYFIHLKSIL